MSLEDEMITGRDAEHLVSNKVWKLIWSRMNDHIDTKMMAIDAKDDNAAKDAVRVKQLLKAIQREAERIIQEGEMARIQFDELEKQSKLRLLRR